MGIVEDMPKILVVDDSLTLRKMIIVALRPLNPITIEAQNGLEAIEHLTLHSFDAITLDLNMPDMHGLEFLQFIRRHDRMRNIPVVVISTRTDESDQAAVLTAGANEYITKPFAPGELCSTLKGLIEKEG